jgi:hypothetical protein
LQAEENFKKMKQQKGFLYAYAAGLIDGEGCIHISKEKPETMERAVNSKYGLTVIVDMADGKGIDLLYGLFGGKIKQVDTNKRKSFIPYTFDKSWHWEIYGTKAKEMLKKIYPFLRIKKEQARIAIDFRTRQEKDIEKRKRIIFRDEKGRIQKRNALIPPELIQYYEYCYQKLKELKKIHSPPAAVETERDQSSIEDKRQSK